MKEFAMVLWAMTASHSTTPPTPMQPTPVVTQAESRKPARELTNEEHRNLVKALDRMERCSTGKLVYDQASGLHVPEQKTNCQ